jgi:hypothetical protein
MALQILETPHSFSAPYNIFFINYVCAAKGASLDHFTSHTMEKSARSPPWNGFDSQWNRISCRSPAFFSRNFGSSDRHMHTCSMDHPAPMEGRQCFLSASLGHSYLSPETIYIQRVKNWLTQRLLASGHGLERQIFFAHQHA